MCYRCVRETARRVIAIATGSRFVFLSSIPAQAQYFDMPKLRPLSTAEFAQFRVYKALNVYVRISWSARKEITELPPWSFHWITSGTGIISKLQGVDYRYKEGDQWTGLGYCERIIYDDGYYQMSADGRRMIKLSRTEPTKLLVSIPDLWILGILVNNNKYSGLWAKKNAEYKRIAKYLNEHIAQLMHDSEAGHLTEGKQFYSKRRPTQITPGYVQESSRPRRGH
ncbi:uncharacterized protein LOC117180719 [Belonocnema kinseyi]|uniref:uncharacterized protein LOC117180719 n=1 Tax=Belonocnema kinseyi TaxID=2817044 RepID=UPI00143D8C6E|nr:uncharacterized protein LOC117180719 [Belonocnema kinseyi]